MSIKMHDIFLVNAENFEPLALKIFHYQYAHNHVYNQYCSAIRIDPDIVKSLKNIPFLPIQFFKSKHVMTGSFTPEMIFESSGTTGNTNSRHFVRDRDLYEESFLLGFEKIYGNASNYCILGLLPSYINRGNSSLVYMVNALIKKSENADSGFYLYEHTQLYETLLKNEAARQPTILIGVTYALLDFAEQYTMQLQHTIVMETGGMKGRRQELTREEVHQMLQQRLGIHEVHSEYGMTELLSQAYSRKNGIFSCPPWMKVLLRANDDPFDVTLAADILNNYQGGAVNIIDLANLHSSSFIATDDVGKLYADGNFEVLGRLDNSDTRGCGLMIV